MRQNGFTLIELLVVIAIIAILAAILFPVFASARATAKQAGCLSNMKQIAMGMMMYADTANSRVCLAYNASTNMSWDIAIYRYTKNYGIYKCPGDSTLPVPKTYPYVTLTPPMKRSYSMNGTDSGVGNPGIENLSEVRKPSRTVLVSEYWVGFRGYAFFNAVSSQSFAALTQAQVVAWNPNMRFHRTGQNIVWADGHAAWIDWRDIKSEMWKGK